MPVQWRALPCIRLIGTPIEPSQKVPLPPLCRPFSKPPGTAGAERLQLCRIFYRKLFQKDVFSSMGISYSTS